MEKLAQISRVLLLAIIFVLSSFFSNAQSFTVTEIGNRSNLSSRNYYEPQISFYTDHFKENSKIGFYAFSLVTETWGQAYAGIVIKPYDWFALSLGVGLEVDPNPYRYNITLFMKKNKLSFLQIYEYGGSGLWYNILLNYEFSKQNYLGLIAKRYYGVGPHYEQRFKKTPIGLIFFPSYDFESEDYKFTILLRYYIN